MPYQLLWGFDSDGEESKMLNSLYASGVSDPADGGDNGAFIYNNIKIQF